MPEPITLTLEALLPPSLNRPRTISPPGAFVRVQERPDGTLLIVAPRPDPFGKIGRSFRELSRQVGLALFPQVARMAADLERTMAQVQAMLRASQPSVVAANTLPKIAGLEARYYVRAALDPAYVEPDQFARLVRRVLAGEGDDDLVLVNRENRISIAVSAMRGWEERGLERLHPVVCARPPYPCAEQVAVGAAPWHTCSPQQLWRCEGHTAIEPPLIAVRQWGSTRVEVRCG